MPIRSLFRIAKGPLWLIAYLSPRLYMPLYIALLRVVGVKFTGTPRYISPGCKFDDFELITLGDNVVISNGTILLTHDYSLTTALISIDRPPATDVAFLRPITIGNNVFIGMGVLILPGAHILDNTIVGAGSVVRGTMGPDAIVAGNPASLICTMSEKAESWQKLKESGKVLLRIDKR